jgi:hypothetical protein
MAIAAGLAVLPGTPVITDFKSGRIPAGRAGPAVHALQLLL